MKNRAIAPAILGAVFVAMAAWTRGGWPDVLVDFGAQLYVPWQILEGKALYVDLVYPKGPLSPYLNALWFRIFGVSLTTLVAANLVILAVVVTTLYRILREIGSAAAALLACVVFLVVFAFGQLIGAGNYNFVCPYSHAVTHGFALSAAAVLGLLVYLRSPSRPVAAGIGLAAGGTFLTDAPVFLALAVALAVGLALVRERRLAAIATVAGSAAIPPVLAFLALLLVLAPGDALRGTLGSWPWLAEIDLFSMKFYKEGMGAGDTGGRLGTMGLKLLGYLAVLGPAAALALLSKKPGPHRTWIAAGVFAVVCAVLFRTTRAGTWVHIVQPVPLLMLALAVALLYRYARHRQDPALAARLVAVVWGGALLAKITLNARTYHYGFVLAVPATLVLVIALVDWVPAAISRRGGDGRVFLAAGLAVLVVGTGFHLRTTSFWLDTKTVRVGEGADAFRADARGAVVNDALREIEQRLGPDGTFTAFPEGVMMNYLSRRRTPTRYHTFIPFTVFTLGETPLLDSLRADPPDLVVLVHKDTSDEGFRFFGRDYARHIGGWIRDHYRRVATFGEEPFTDDRFGIVLLERRYARSD